MLQLFFTLFALAYCGNYSIIYAYAPTDTSCSGSLEGFVATNNPTFCSASACACTAQSCAKTECGVTSLPSVSGNAIIYASYASSDCSGDATQYSAAQSGLCTNTTSPFGGAQSSQKFTCSGGTFSYQIWNSVSDCSGTANQNTNIPFSGSLCTAVGGSGSQYIACNSVCFHKSTTVTYEGKPQKLHDLKASQDCAIPHKVVSDGVKVSTTCPGVLRLTHRHLVMTPEGWIEAGNLKKGSKLYSKIGAETADCEVTSVETELKQEYFGLNCYESNVLADGYWVSTFGNQHRLPAAWMKVGGAVLGIHRASAWGDAVVQTLEGWGWL